MAGPGSLTARETWASSTISQLREYQAVQSDQQKVSGFRFDLYDIALHGASMPTATEATS